VINAIRAHLAEFGIVAPVGRHGVEQLLGALLDKNPGNVEDDMMTEPNPLEELEALKKEAIKAASETTDAHIQNWIRFVIGWEEFHRGRTAQAQESARELLQIGQALNDPRSTGLGLLVLMWIALVSDSYGEALAYSEQSLATAIAPLEIDGALVGKGCALILLRRTREGAAMLAEGRRRCVTNGNLYPLVGSEAVLGVCRVLDGHIKDGIRSIEEAIQTKEGEGYRDVADWYRLYLAEVYLQIISGQERPPFPIVVRNLWVILKVGNREVNRVCPCGTHPEEPAFSP
jgi:hypothetical protein